MLDRSRHWTLVLAAILAASSASFAEPVAWDQTKVTEIAERLVAAVDTVDKEMRSRQLGDQNRRDFYRLRETIRRCRSEARRLAGGLKADQGHDETLPVFEQLMVQVRDAREISARVFLTAPLQEPLTAARSVLNELAPYYDAAPLTPKAGAR